MCGFVSVVSDSPTKLLIAEKNLDAAIHKLRHQGPDENGPGSRDCVEIYSVGTLE
jgi:asparagine synthetase B (glutamine-hydrolysing)